MLLLLGRKVRHGRTPMVPLGFPKLRFFFGGRGGVFSTYDIVLEEANLECT